MPQFAYLEVLVRIEDVNDNVPQSVDPAYYGSIQENIRNVQSIITIQANDGDRNPNQALNFAITGGNPQNFFSIDPVHGKFKYFYFGRTSFKQLFIKLLYIYF